MKALLIKTIINNTNLDIGFNEVNIKNAEIIPRVQIEKYKNLIYIRK